MEGADTYGKGWDNGKGQEPWVDLMKAVKTKYWNYDAEWLKLNK
jgi:hypothetical protein